MAYTAIDNPELYFQVKLYTGTGSSLAVTLDGSEDMQPDLIWIKERTGTESHTWTDAVRGVTKWISSNNTDDEVIGIDDMSGGYEDNVHFAVRLYKRDLSVDDIIDIFEKHKPDIVYHFAAYAAEGLSPFIRKFNYSNNIVGTMNIVNNCIEHRISYSTLT